MGNRANGLSDLVFSVARMYSETGLLPLRVSLRAVSCSWWIFVVLFLATPLFHHPAQAAPDKRVALLIGNARYTSGLPPLSNPPKDTAGLEASLKKLNFAVQRITDGDQKAMGRAIKQFGNDAQDAQVAFFYYSGHGMQARDENYLIPIAAQIETEAELDGEAINLRGVLRQIEDARPQNAVIVLDACRDNPVAGRSKNASKGLSRVQSQPTNTLVVFAAQAGTTASDNGVFAKALASHITQPNVGMRVVFDNVGKAVRSASGNKQSIQRDDQLSEDIVLLASVGGVPTGGSGQSQADPEQETWDLAKRRDTAQSYQAYLNAYPSGRYATPARAALEGLQQVPALRPTAPTPQPTAQPLPQAAPATQSTGIAQTGQVFKDCADCPEMVVIPAGSFTMGSNENESEKPPHLVNIRSFALGKYEVTQGQWKAVMGSNPSNFQDCGDSCPVEKVSRDDVQQYIQKLNQQTGKQFRLPSEAEWEYAARAGSTGKWTFGDDEKLLDEHAWFGTGFFGIGDKTRPVGQKLANVFGLHDMHGNVSEWVQDVWHDNYTGAPTDGSAWLQGGDSSRGVLRGGSWLQSPGASGSAGRGGGTPSFQFYLMGFRIARTVP
jgi:formylglycine-generating enzyme required for sulfatase activity